MLLPHVLDQLYLHVYNFPGTFAIYPKNFCRKIRSSFHLKRVTLLGMELKATDFGLVLCSSPQGALMCSQTSVRARALLIKL